VLEFIPQLNFNQKALYKGKINPLSFGEIRERLAVLEVISKLNFKEKALYKGKLILSPLER
jgi:hypothetical protein